jgi:hypothetical protein
MKKALLYLLLFSYSIIVVKPVLPTVSDTIAHIFWYSEHMATVHYEHGQYHVHMEYTEAAKKGYPEKNNTVKEDETVNFHLSTIHTYNFITYAQAKPACILSSSMLPLIYGSCHYPPPKTV